jgi:acetyl esterase
MHDDPRWDSEMRALRRRMEEMAARHPPVIPAEPFDEQRLVNDALNLPWAEGGPEMAESEDRWVAARGRRILCRVHRPHAVPPGGPPPVLVWFHGGGWVWSSVDTHDRLTREYAAAAGIVVVNVDYALSPEAKFPQGLLECAAVVRAIAADGPAKGTRSWGIDPARIVLGGDSAGGNLALATALLLRDSYGPPLCGVLACYPVTAADFSTPSYREFATGYGLTSAAMQAYWDLYLTHAADRLNPLAAPLLADHAGMPPTLLQLAEIDVLRSDGERLAAKMRAAGVAVTCETIAGVAHGFMRLTGHLGAARGAVERAGAWLREVTAPS